MVGRVTAGKVFERQREGPWEIYVGHGAPARAQYGDVGTWLANAYPMGYGGTASNDDSLRAEVCELCAQLNDPARSAPRPRDRRAEPLTWLITPEARRRREAELEALAERVANGESLRLLCHCRRMGEARKPWNRCHADDLTNDICRRAEAKAARRWAAPRPAAPPRPPAVRGRKTVLA